MPHPATATQLKWLEGELDAWQAEGLVDLPTATALRSRYVAVRRLTVLRVLLTLGTGFLGTGLIWLVAANLDQLSPPTRFVGVTALWLAVTASGEWLATARGRGGEVSSPVVEAVRLLGVAAYGAVLFQAAQSLQVPAYEPTLVGLWGLGALLLAYAVRSTACLTAAVLLLAGWWLWALVDAGASPVGATAAALSAAVVAAAVGAVHSARWWPDFTPPWREVGAALALVGVFVAAVPADRLADSRWSTALTVALVVAALAAAVAVTVAPEARLEVALAAGALVAGLLLALWRPGTGTSAGVGLAPAEYVRAAVAVLLYLAVASGYAVLGASRDSGRLTLLATAAIVVFTTFQAFAVFAPILSGAALFLTVGVVLLVTGWLGDRGRRRLARGRSEVPA